jgi:hypothetical protein
MTTITANVGKGWDTLKASDYFRADNDDTNDPTRNLMSTLHKFEEAHIMYSTMKRLNVIMNEKREDFHH